MYTFKHLTCLLIVVFLLAGNFVFAQPIEINAATNYDSREKAEFDMIKNQKADNIIPQYLLDQYSDAKNNYDGQEKLRIGKEIEKYLPDVLISTPIPGVEPLQEINPPFIDSWVTTDILVHSGDVANYGFRQIDLKRGEDGWMYLCVNRRNISGSNGGAQVYRSSNGGANWVGVQGFITGSYVQSISMLVENRSANNSVGDSTRIIIYFTYAASTSWNDASVGYVTFRRDGSAWYNGTAGSPPSGSKFEYVSACSDGMYYDVATYMHCVVRQVTNSGTDQGIRHFLTQNWCASHSTAIFNPGNEDFYPSVQYGDKNTGNDSLYIAVERRISSTEYELRLFAISEWTSSSNYFTYYISSAGANTYYKKPELTIVQQRYTVPKRMLITCTRNDNPRYFYSSNGAETWTIDQLLGPNTTCQADFTTCSSDSLTPGGQYVIMGYVSNDGDSVNVKQTSIPPGSIYNYYKRNSHNSSGVVAPSAAIYKSGSTKYAAFAYPGSGPNNVYYNAEQLQTGITSNGKTASVYSLNQNYPNPFNPSTKIQYSIPERAEVKITVFDILGREVLTLVNEFQPAGTYEFDFDAGTLSSGIYFYKMQAGNFSEVKKMTLIK